jgi:S-adenosylmethionine:tRNA ribosyltransferase-isomerase
MRLSDFDFELPPDRIALRPARPRDAARLLMVSADGGLEDRRMGELPALLSPGDLLVFNDTRVIAARLTGVRQRDGARARVEATLLRAVADAQWTALMKPGKRLRPGDEVVFTPQDPAYGDQDRLTARVVDKAEDGVVVLAFDCGGAALMDAIARIGTPPLPPYIAAQRAQDLSDRTDYQTVYAAKDGSVAAPTAGLHFTPALFSALAAAGIGTTFLTLHVGAGTFLPVKSEDVDQHRMHAEVGEITGDAAAAINAARAAGRRVICVGTTTLRLLETAAGEGGLVAPFTGETAIFIKPGYRFKAADGLLTNFHLPRSTLIMLVAAFAGLQTTKAAYAHAVACGYRFYSYGDAGLWFRSERA